MEQRRSRRFTLELPLAIVRSGAERVKQAGHTKNISSGGVLFTSEAEPDVGEPIEYIITLSGPSEHRVNLRCIGKIVRYRKAAEANKTGFDVAATLERYEFMRVED